MSKVVAVKMLIQDLTALERACTRLGLELVRGQQTYRWYGDRGQKEGVPEGFQRAELGHCEHAIRIPNNPTAYEIGVVTRRDGQAGYTLLWDSWNKGYGMTDYVGEGCETLSQMYTMEVALDQFAQLNHYMIEEQQTENGDIILTFAAQGA